MITGATGHLGQKVVAELNKLVPSRDIRLGVHTPKKAANLVAAGFDIAAIDYADTETLIQAFAGVDVLIYIPSLTYEVQGRINEFENTLTAMEKDRVKTIVDVSFFADQYNNPFQMAGYYAYLPARLASSHFQYAVVKNSLYADPLVP